MVAKLSVRKNAVGLANNYGVVFEWAERGELSYTLRFPSWQEFYTRQTIVGQRPETATLLDERQVLFSGCGHTHACCAFEFDAYLVTTPRMRLINR
ncbi:hypothetical protein MRX96_038780 [Rhipicephalus microplus]